jgi:hypothetical protein
VIFEEGESGNQLLKKLGNADSVSLSVGAFFSSESGLW